MCITLSLFKWKLKLILHTKIGLSLICMAECEKIEISTHTSKDETCIER